MKPYARAERVGGLIQAALADILRKSIKDPRLEGVSLTGVKMTPDLKLARVYFVAPGDRREAAAAFKKAQGFIKHTLSQELELRYMPELQFFYDESIEYGMHIDKVLKQLKNEDGTDPHSTEEE